MDFENLIWLAAIVFYVIPAVIKRLGKKAAPPSSEQPASAQKGAASRFMEKALGAIKALEQQAAEAKKKTPPQGKADSPWDLLVAEEEDLALEFSDADMEGLPAVPVAASPSAPEPMKPVRKATSPSPVIRKSSAPGVEPASEPVSLAMTPRNLRSAVVWSEILSAPLALRDES